MAGWGGAAGGLGLPGARPGHGLALRDGPGAPGGVQTGTTIMAATYEGGVVLGADSRTSSGSYVANKTADKITQLAERVYMCRSGSAADTQAVSSYVQHYLHQHKMELGEEVDVETAANLVKSIAYQNKDRLSAGMLVAGWDAHAGGSVWTVPLGGTLLRVPVAAGGSGSIYISGWLDKFWKPGMTKEECQAFVVKAISLAMSRDGSSGGCIRTVTIDASGPVKEFVPGQDVPLHHDELPARPAGVGMEIAG